MALGEQKQWFIKTRPTIYVGLWFFWLLSPFIVIGTLEAIRGVLGIPDEVMRSVDKVFAKVWLPGVVVFAVLVIVGLRVAPGVSNEASKEQVDFEGDRR